VSRLRTVLGSDDAFTLVELLIAILVVGIILPAIGATFYIAMKTTDDTNRRLLDSHDIESAGAFVNSDVQNATTISTTDTTSCVAAAYPASQAALYLTWTDRSTEGVAIPHQVNYYVSGSSLVRSACLAGVSTGALAIIAELDLTSPPAVVCHGPSDCASVTAPQSVALRGTTVSGQMFSLIGTRRTG
jgi:prepilin-type N-terminal cleavage/methylation domain-containing protein